MTPPEDGKYKVWFRIKQYTEIPLFVDGLDERLGWYRSWTSWQRVNLQNLVLFHKPEQEEGKEGVSRIYAEEIIKGGSPSRSVSVAFDKMNIKLNILSLISQKGFLIESVFPSPSIGEDLLSQLNKYEISNLGNQTMQTKPKDLKQMNPFFSQMIMTAGKENDDYLIENVSVVFNVQEEPNIHRNIYMIKLTELQEEWNRAFTIYSESNIAEQFIINQAMELHRVALTSRELYSRYLLEWIAMDSLTPFIDRIGPRKITGMSKFIGLINGVTDLKLTLEDIYRLRNEIAHGRARQIAAFDVECKRALLWLEWILMNFVRTKLGLNQLPEKAAPKELLEHS